MSIAPEHLTWQGSPSDDVAPRRPSTDDLGGDEKIDDAEYPPNDKEHPTAGGWNQQVRQIVAIAQVTSACKLEIRYSSGAPFVARVASPSPDVTPATFDVTDNGTGDVSITWPADTFPPHGCSPTGLTPLSTSTRLGSVEEISNGIRVRFFDTEADPADTDFTICIN